MTHRTKGVTASVLVEPTPASSRSFGAEADLLQFLGDVAVPRGGSVAVIAGRFTPRQAGTQAPAESEEALRSFRLGARLLHEGTMRSRARAHLVVLVDDHPVGGPRPGLRFDELPIPSPFLQVLAAEGLTARDALRPCSEEDLRRRHVRDLERAGRRDPRLGAPDPNRCLFAGEMLRLLLDVAACQITDVVFFPPPSLSPEAALAADLVPRWAAEAGLGCPVLHLVSCSGPLIVASRAA